MFDYDIYLDKSLKKLSDYMEESNTRPILFVGSGISQRYYGGPSWIQLLKILFDRLPNARYPIEYYLEEYNNDYPKVANELVNLYREHFWQKHESGLYPENLFSSSYPKNIYLKYSISKIFKDLMKDFSIENNALSSELKLLRELKPQNIITTNYDTLLETLFPKYNVIIGQETIYGNRSNNSFNIYKIHGCVNNYDKIVIDEYDYKNFDEKQLYLTAKLFTYFIEHPIIFLGYSLNDRNIQKILYSVKRMIDSDVEPMLDNMWFIDWSEREIPKHDYISDIKSISIGTGESVKMNYIKLHRYEKLYETLYQDSLDIDSLKIIENTMYNIIKSDSITNLEVDIASLRYIANPQNFLEGLSAENEKQNFITLSTISEPNQLAAQYSLTATDLAQIVYKDDNRTWHSAYDLIDKIERQTGFFMRGSQNKYYVDMGGISRFSKHAVELLEKVKNNESYIVIDGDMEYKYLSK